MTRITNEKPLTGVLLEKQKKLESTEILRRTMQAALAKSTEGKTAFGSDPNYKPASSAPLTNGTRVLHRSGQQSSLMGKLGNLFKAKAHGATIPPDSKRSPLLGGNQNSYGTAGQQSENDM